MKNRSAGENVFNVFNIIFILMLVIVSVYPMVYTLFASLSNPQDMLAHRGVLYLPYGFTLGSYKSVFEDPMILKGYANTLFVIVVGVFVNILFTSLAAYVLSRKNVLFKPFIMFMIVFTMFFQGGLIPFYLTVREMGLFDTRWALILPVAVSSFNLIIMRTGFMAIPDSLEESARIDGANHLTILFRIVIPLSMPIVAVMILYYGVSHWNAWFNASIFLRDRNLYPLQLRLREILMKNDMRSMTGSVTADSESVSLTVRYAVIIVSTLPILILYPFLQRYFVKGIMIGSVKG